MQYLYVDISIVEYFPCKKLEELLCRSIDATVPLVQLLFAHYAGILTCKVNRACQYCQEKIKLPLPFFAFWGWLFCWKEIRISVSDGEREWIRFTNIHKYHLIDMS